MAQNCYLYFESRGWSGIKYWPAVAMRWVLTNLDKQIKKKWEVSSHHHQEKRSVRDKVMERETEQEDV